MGVLSRARISMADFTVAELKKGQVMEYFSTRRKMWVETVIDDIDVSSDRVRVDAKSTWFLKKEFGKLLRKPRCEVDDEDLQIVPARADEGEGERKRGAYDSALVVHAQTCLQSCGSVTAVLEKIAACREDLGSRTKYRERLLGMFPKSPQSGVCYIPFNSPPSTGKLTGHLHLYLSFV